jgi:hypothetical protein
MFGHAPSKNRLQLADEIRECRTAMVPEGRAVGHVGKAQHFFDAAVAIGRDHEHTAGESVRDALWQLEHDIVVELALSPMSHKLVAPETAGQVFEQSPEHEKASKMIDFGGHAFIVAAGSAVVEDRLTPIYP